MLVGEKKLNLKDVTTVLLESDRWLSRNVVIVVVKSWQWKVHHDRVIVITVVGTLGQDQSRGPRMIMSESASIV